MVDYWLQFIQKCGYPASCLLCGNPGHKGLNLCAGCANDIRLNTQACRLCGLPLPCASLSICGSCLKKKPSFDSCISPHLYSYPLDRLILAMKYQQKLAAGRLLGELMAARLDSAITDRPQAILPVPLHRRRLRQRGYNQAVEIARPVARQLQIPLATNLCTRVRDTSSQRGLTAKERKRNIRDAFEMRQPCQLSHVAILDDVMTTGATVSELSKILKKAGVERVDIWACARA